MKANDIRYTGNQKIEAKRPKKSEVSGEKTEDIQLQTGKDGFTVSEDTVFLPPDLRKINRYKTLVDFAEGLESKPVSDEKEWTVLFYMDGANDLEPFIAKSLLEMEKVGSTDKVNLVAQMARLSQDELRQTLEKKYNKTIDPSSDQYRTNIDNDWRGVRRYFVTKNENPASRQYSSKLEKNLFINDISHPQTLADFVSWGMKTYPAKHYMLVIMDHGAGWPGAMNNEYSGPSGSMMSTPSIGKALQAAEKATGKELDVVHFATCLMGSAEVAYELKDSVNYMIASEETGTKDALDYKDIIKKLNLEVNLNTATPERIANMIVDHYRDPDNTGSFLTHAAVDLKKMDAVKEGLDKFAEALKKTSVPIEVIKEDLQRAQSYGKVAPYRPFTDYRDLVEVADVLLEDQRIEKVDENLRYAAHNLKKAVEDSVINKTPPGIYKKEEKMYVEKEKEGRVTKTHWMTTEEEIHGNGLSIYLPLEPNVTYDKMKEDYQQLKLSQDTQWDEYLEKEVPIHSKEVQLKLFPDDIKTIDVDRPKRN